MAVGDKSLGKLSRRRVLELGLGLVSTGLPLGALAQASSLHERRLSFYNLHTGESFSKTYYAGGTYVQESLAEIDYILRDFRTGDVTDIDVRLLDLLFVLRQKLDSRDVYHVVSGYRSPRTNAMLADRSRGVAKRSLHMKGMAIDTSLPDRELRSLRRTAVALRLGGVGYYPKPGFVHLDVGRVRAW